MLIEQETGGGGVEKRRERATAGAARWREEAHSEGGVSGGGHGDDALAGRAQLEYVAGEAGHLGELWGVRCEL